MMFGDFAFELRRQKKMTLREFCAYTGFNPTLWSQIERNVALPPSNSDLEKVANVLGLADDSTDRGQLFSLAEDIRITGLPSRADDEIADTLPLFCRTLDNAKPSEKQLRELSELLKQG